MQRVRNPFKATFGASPPLLAGRNDAISDFRAQLCNDSAHERVSLIVGPRGIGKTVLLNAFEDAATDRGWHVLSETATAGFTDRLRNEIIRILANHGPQARNPRLSLFQVGFSADWSSPLPDTATYTLRNALQDLLTLQRELDQKSGQRPTGVLITLDEMHHQRGSEVVDFGSTIQHLIRDNEEIAVVMAGIPSSIRPLLDSAKNQNPVSFYVALTASIWIGFPIRM